MDAMLSPTSTAASATKIRFFTLPNLFTLVSLNLGAWATMTALTGGGTKRAALALLAAGVCDALDGRVARATRTSSPLGGQLDSLADVISFGLAPAALAWAGGLSQFGAAGMAACASIATAAALRLARFNVDSGTAPKTHFQGLPTTLAAGALALVQLLDPAPSPVLVLALAPALAALMISDLRFLSFKVGVPARIAVAAGLGLASLAVFVGPAAALVSVLAAYLTWGLWENAASLAKAGRAPA